jgi:hypothetical protein
MPKRHNAAIPTTATKITMATAEPLVSLFWKYANNSSAFPFLDETTVGTWIGGVALTADVFCST